MLKTIWHWFFHSWGPWTYLENRFYGYDNWLLIRRRSCTVCGYIQVKREVV